MIHCGNYFYASYVSINDVISATTHTDLMIRARNLGIKVEVVHNASVMGAAASCGLQVHSYQ